MIENNSIKINGIAYTLPKSEGTNKVLNNFDECETRNVQYLNGDTGTLGLQNEAINVLLNVVHTHETEINKKKAVIDCVGVMVLKEVNGALKFDSFRHASIPALFRRELQYTAEDVSDTTTGETAQKLCLENGEAISFNEFKATIANGQPMTVTAHGKVKVLRFIYDEEAEKRKTQSDKGGRIGERNITLYRLNAAKQAAVNAWFEANQTSLQAMEADYKAWLAAN